MAWVHSLAGLESPTSKPIVQSTLQDLKESLVQKRKPITVEILSDMVKDTLDNPTLANLRITTFSLLAFAGFLRFDEAIHLRACEIKITTDVTTVESTYYIAKWTNFNKGVRC